MSVDQTEWPLRVEPPHLGFQSGVEESPGSGESGISGETEVPLRCRCRRLGIVADICAVRGIGRDHRRLNSLALQLAYALRDETAGSIVVGRRVEGRESQYVHREWQVLI